MLCHYMSLFDLEEKKPAQALIVPFGKSSEHIINLLSQVETFDNELLDNIQNHIKIAISSKPDSSLETIVDEIIKAKQLPVVIGGEPNISYDFTRGIAG